MTGCSFELISGLSRNAGTLLLFYIFSADARSLFMTGRRRIQRPVSHYVTSYNSAFQYEEPCETYEQEKKASLYGSYTLGGLNLANSNYIIPEDGTYVGALAGLVGALFHSFKSNPTSLCSVWGRVLATLTADVQTAERGLLHERAHDSVDMSLVTRGY